MYVAWSGADAVIDVQAANQSHSEFPLLMIINTEYTTLCRLNNLLREYERPYLDEAGRASS